MPAIAGPPRCGTRSDAPTAAALHAAQISDGFLVTLGPRFLRRLYVRTVRFSGSFLLVANDTEGMTGFVAVAEATGRFYREFLLRDGVVAAFAAAPAVTRAPKQVWETFRYGFGSTDDGLPPAEILAIAVSPRARRQGVGGALVDAALVELRRRGISGAQVVTSADNDAAISMYERAGFRRHHRTEVHAGEPQEVLVWR